jgi:hypothetical protein
MKHLLLTLAFTLAIISLSAQSLDTINIGKPHSNNGLGEGERLWNAWEKINDHMNFTNAAVYPIMTVKASNTTGLGIFNVVDYSLNKIRTTWAQQTDTSAVSIGYTYTGSPTVTVTSKTGYTLFKVDSVGIGIGTGTPFTKLSVLLSGATSTKAFNFTETDVNKVRTTFATGTDTSSVNLAFTSTGSPTLNVTGKTGNALFGVDSASVFITVGDTNVAKKYGRLVFKLSDSTLYVCKYIRPTGKHCWYKLDN